jgi:hypothetical protein
MPFLEGPFAFTGKLDMFSAYRMRGVDGIVVRRKGGPSAEKIKTGESFKNTRRTMSEFGGCSRLGSYVRKALIQIRHLSDYNFGSDINSVMRQVQLRDGTGEWGRRRITLSEHTRLLEGFSTTKKAPTFDSIVRAPVYYTLNRRDRSARVDIPELLRDINYFPQNNHAMFRLTITLGIVPDVTFDIPSKEYLPQAWYSRAFNSISVSTDWSPSLEGMAGTTLKLAMEALPPDDSWTLMLSIGIEYGAFRQNGKIEEVRRFGAAKIMSLQGKDGILGDSHDDDRIENNEEHAVKTETIREEAPAIESQHEPMAMTSLDVRYVYTVKAAATEKPETHVYGYAIPAAVWEDVHDINTTQNAVSLYEATSIPRDGVKPYVASFMKTPSTMSYTVFFKEAKLIVRADNFINEQPVAHRAVLKTIADELAAQGTITHPQAKRNSKGDWSLLLVDNGDAYVYTLFISTFERAETNREVKTEAPQKKGVLTIIDPSGPRDSVGGSHPGYWFVEQYVNFLEENQRALFTETVHQIEHNIPSKNYSLNKDGSVSIHIQETGKTATISLTCRAAWV